MECAVGLTSVLTGHVSLDQAIRPWGVDMFDVLPSGPIPLNPSELLASGRMRDVLSDLAERYEFVLIDAPPLLPVTDAAVLGAQCDGALLTVRYGRTTRRQVKAAVSVLDVTSVRLLGTTLIMAPDLGSDVSYDDYYYEADTVVTGADVTATQPLSVGPAEGGLAR
jgi:capsular exopolysaccharide synthesis family protein